MPTLIEYASLAAYIYNDQRGGGGDLSTLNRLTLPNGWSQIEDKGFTGGTYLNANPFSFTAGAYVSAAGEIVISYKGTDFLTEFEGRSWNTVADLVADVGLALSKKAIGVWNLQQVSASTYFLAVKDWAVANGYDPSKISFTGHSLGGGLAANMAAWYDRPATTFAEAPFELSTINPAAITAAAATLTLQAGVTASPAVLEEINKLRNLLIPGEYQKRQEAVTNYHIGGEFLQYLRTALPTVVGTNKDNTIDIGSQILGRAVSLHSMNLHLALLIDERLRLACIKVPELVPALLSIALYAVDPNQARKDFVTSLVADQLRGNVTRQDGLLGRFAVEVQQLATSAGTVAQPALRTALIAAAMEYCLNSTTASAKPLFTVTAGSLDFKYGDISASATALKSPALLAKAAGALAGDAAHTVEGAARSIGAWHVQSGTGAMNWSGSGTIDDAALGGTGADTLSGGGGNDLLLGLGGADLLLGGTGTDILIGGDGADTLDGGSGPDYLYGGEGFDTYDFTGTFGGDWIVDSDGKGTIKVDGTALTGGRFVVPGFYKDSATGWSYSVAGADLILAKDGSINQIRVRDWQPKQLGITLDETPIPPVTTSTLTGDLAKSITGDHYNLDSTGYASAGLQAGAFDIFNGTAEAEELFGLGGNDGLSGGDGDDLLDGGAGDDLLIGGRGADTLNGGAGNDFIYGSATGLVATPSALNFTPPAIVPNSVEAARGFSWVASRAIGQRWSADGNTASMLDVEITGANVAPGYVIGGQTYVETSGNVINAGTGNDYVAAGMGADVVHGGDGDDDLYGMGDNDVLFGDEGSDFIRGDGVADQRSGHWTPDVLHGNDILVGGAGRDVLIGQGGDDELYGGTEDDFLWGDDTNPTDTPLAVHGNDYLDGGDGADRLEGGGLDDELHGGAGNDRLWGDGSNSSGVSGAYQGKDYLDGEGGDDQLTGGGNDDQLFGGIGNDLLWGDDAQSVTPLANQGRDYLDGEEGNDQLVGGGNADTLYGGDGNDVMLGDDDAARVAATSHGDDYLDGEAGNDSLFGGGGNDVLFGSEGSDYLNGDDDKSRLGFSAHGNDTLDGGEGNDELVGAGGSDLLFGGSGDDVLQGDEISSKVDVSVHGNDTLDGGEGNDTLFGGGAADELLGGLGADTLQGGIGNDSLEGGDGNDALRGEAGADTLMGGNGADGLSGGDGNDYLDGGDGLDGLFGGAGDDVLISDGQDYLDGGEGDDTYRIAAMSSGTVATYDDASGRNTVYIAGASAASSQVFAQNGSWYLKTGGGGVVGLGGNALLTGMVLKSDENDVGVSAQEVVERAGTGGLVRSGSWNGTTVTYTRDVATAQTLIGTERAEWLEGGAGIDNLRAGDGNDRLDGGAGTDVLAGGTGADTIRGGRGGDTLWAANESGDNDREQDVFVFARGDGSDYIRFAALPADSAKDVIRFDAGIGRGDIAVSAILSTDGSSALPRLTISYGGSDRISLEAGAEGTIEGLQFADGSSMTMAEVLKLLPATPGGSTVVTEGDDFLLGTLLNDDLRGRGGNDTLIGGGGDDVLQGNDGRNVYQFAGASGKDVILPTSGEHATLIFSDADASNTTIRLEGDNLVVRMGIDNSVQVVGFKQLTDAPRNWLVQFGQGEPITVEALLSASAIPDPAALGDRRDRFLAQQRVELQTLPQRVFKPAFESGRGAVPVGLTQTSLSLDTSGSLALPDFLSLSTQSFTAVHRYKREIVELVRYEGPVFDNGVAFISIAALGTGYYTSLLEPSPVYGPPDPNQSGGRDSSSLGHGPLLGYFVRNAWSTSTPRYRVVGYTDEVETSTTTIAADTANQTQAAGSAGGDYIFSPSLAQFRGAIDAGAGNDYVYLNSVTESWTFESYEFDRGIYISRLDSNRDWAPLDIGNSYILPSLYAYRERGLGAWIDAGDGNDFVFGTDAADTIIGGRGSDYLNGQAGADTYLIGRDAGSVDRISDGAAFRLDDQYYYFLYGGRASNFHQDTVEFEVGIDCSRMSYKWLPNSGNELELYLDGQLFLQISYDNDGSAGLAGAAGIERFVFSNGEVFSLEQLRAVLPEMQSEPPPAPPQLLRPLPDASVDEDTAMFEIDVTSAFVDPKGAPLTYQLLTSSGSQLPAWLRFDATTGLVTGRPGNDDVGVLGLVVRATNSSGLSTSDQFDITVVNVNDKPVVSGAVTTRATMEEGTSYSRTIDWFSDVDVGDKLRLSVKAIDGSSLPRWLTIDPITRLLTAAPPLGALGSVVVALTATDLAGQRVSTKLVIEVRSSADMPIVETPAEEKGLDRPGNETPNAAVDLGNQRAAMSTPWHTDELVTKNWYAPSANQLEGFRLSDGSNVLASEVQGLISAMAAFAAPEGMMTTGNVTPSMHSMQAWRYQELAASIL